jgi:hypothetical protein
MCQNRSWVASECRATAKATMVAPTPMERTESATALEGWTSSTELVLTGEGWSAKQKGDRVRVAEGGSDLREELWG